MGASPLSLSSLHNRTRKMPSGGKHEHMRTYTPDEARVVIGLVEQHAPRWTHIAKLVSELTQQTRSSASIRNYYKRFQASKAIAERDSSIRKLNRCQMCGQIKRGHICTALNFTTPKASTNSLTEPKLAGPIALTERLPLAAVVTPMAQPQFALAMPTPVAALQLATPPLQLPAVDQPLPPLAPAALEVLTPATSPLSMFSGPLSGLSMLGSPLLPLAEAAAAAPFARPLTATALAAGEHDSNAREDEEGTVTEEGALTDAEAYAEILDVPAIQAAEGGAVMCVA